MYRNDGYDEWVKTKELMVKVQVSERRRLNEPSVVWIRERGGKGDEGEAYSMSILGTREALYLAEARRR
jgi:hypothetical protein